MVELTDEDRVTLARMVTSMLDEWGIKASDQVSLLALPDGTPTRMLRRYHEDTPLPDDPDVMKRVEHLMGIAEALRAQGLDAPIRPIATSPTRSRRPSAG